MTAPLVDLLVRRTRAVIRTSTAEMVGLEDDLHDIVDRIRASERIIEESRRLLDRMNSLAEQTF